MFPTTIWTVVQAAGASDPAALEQIAREYRAPVLGFIRSRGVTGPQAEDLCHDVFVRLLSGGVLAKADGTKGRFRSLLCTVTIRVLQDWSRRHTKLVCDVPDTAVAAPSFDRLWVRYLLERAFRQLKETSPRSYEILRSHLAEEKPDRNKLWIARQKLIALVRQEIAMTCRTPQEVEDEMASLAPYLRPAKID